MDAVRKLIKKDPCVTCHGTETALDIGSTATQSIIHDHLHVRKQCAHWMPHSLMDQHGTSQVERSNSCCLNSEKDVVKTLTTS